MLPGFEPESSVWFSTTGSNSITNSIMKNTYLTSQNLHPDSLDYTLQAYTFDLPEEQIAQYPAQERKESKLLIVDRHRDRLDHDRFAHISAHLPEKSILVTNVSKVIPARLIGRKRATGGKVEFLLLTPLPVVAIQREGEDQAAEVEGLLKPAKGLIPGSQVDLPGGIQLSVLAREDYGRARVRLQWRGDLAQLLIEHGCMPLPPYIRRQPENLDCRRYQTVFAREDKLGSVAAPTAGLHFTTEQIAKLQGQGHDFVQVSLYVGYGTFHPIRVQDIREHQMHSEYMEISEGAAQGLNQARAQGRPVVAVGTTSVRALEGVFQRCGHVRAFSGWTDLFLAPGSTFHVVDHMITNFHLPHSSLLVLVSAFAGRERILRAYTQAVQTGYRFFSYGDAMLIL